MPRNEEQLEAIKELSEIEISRLRKLQNTPDDAVGMDGIDKAACYINGCDSCLDLGITNENGFSDSEIQTASERFTVLTAILFEII